MNFIVLLLQEAHSPKSKQDKYKVFMEACEKFQPVFRHFLMERFPDPAGWYNRRIAYTRSVATNSIGKCVYFYIYRLITACATNLTTN